MRAAVEAFAGTVRPKNQGKLLPFWLDTRDAEARRGTAHVRCVDGQLLVGLDTRRGVFQVWGPSLTYGGWIPICDCQDDYGTPYRGAIPWHAVVRVLRQAREGPLSCDVAEEHNERLRRERDAELDRQTVEGARYYARAIAGELAGWGRWDARDVADGYRNARDGGSKAAPRGRKHSLPGRPVGGEP